MKMTNTNILKSMTDGELFRIAWAATRESIRNVEKWEGANEETLSILREQEKELKSKMEEAFS